MIPSARLVPDASSHEGASHHCDQELQVKHSSCPVPFLHLIIIHVSLYIVQSTRTHCNLCKTRREPKRKHLMYCTCHLTTLLPCLGRIYSRTRASAVGGEHSRRDPFEQRVNSYSEHLHITYEQATKKNARYNGFIHNLFLKEDREGFSLLCSAC
jgi:hypothetical protein